MTQGNRLHVEGLTLVRLAEAVGGRVQGASAVQVRGIHHDSRRIEPGDLFVARRGDRVDGLAFLPQAVERGAAAVMFESSELGSVAQAIPAIVVDDIRAGMAQAASVIYGDPTRSLSVVGITGTNGKTTTGFLTAAAIDGTHQRAALLGTLGARFGDTELPGSHTTPEADEMARFAARMRDAGATHLVMEVSSHALVQKRADGVHFEVAAFTNLTRDHLDYHGSLAAYAVAKERLFFELGPALAVINIDDPVGCSIADRVQCPCLRVSTSQTADICPASPVAHDADGIRCRLTTPQGVVDLQSPLVGGHNLSNLAIAMGIISALELPVEDAAAALARFSSVPGRLERCDGVGDDIVVLVDYAHSPDALERVLDTVRPLTTGRVLCVFGCGGDRDREKRPLMGRAAATMADVVIVTNDNPRSESPQAIAESILEGTKGLPATVEVELQRERAIARAIAMAKAGDVVLIAGKGHEAAQVAGTEIRRFDDREEARGALRIRRDRMGER